MRIIRSTVTAGIAALVPVVWAQNLTQETVGDVWVYDRASDPRYDPILRVWGNGSESYNKNGYPPGEAFSHGYLMFDLSGVAPDQYVVTQAVLRLRMRPATYTFDAALASPLEARALNPGWDEATWDYNAANPNPETVRFGTGDLSGYSRNSEWDMTIDLLAGNGFEDRFNTAVNSDGRLAIALTSSILVQGQGGAPYRLYSRDYGIPGTAPRVSLTFEPVPEPATWGAALAAALLFRRRNRI
jgi:hypothetical protein